MPYCKKCHARIDKFNKDRCPICGEENPFDGIDSKTVEITTSIQTSGLEELDYHPRTRKNLLIFFICLGFFGVPYFYMYRKLAGIIYASINIVSIIALALIFALVANLHIALAIILPILILLVINSLVGIYYFYKPNLKDGRGEFLI